MRIHSTQDQSLIHNNNEHDDDGHNEYNESSSLTSVWNGELHMSLIQTHDVNKTHVTSS